MLPHFDYTSPPSLADCLAAMANPNAQIAPIAGGTNLVVDLRSGRARFGHQLMGSDRPCLGRITWFHDTSEAWVGVELDGSVEPALNSVVPALANAIRNAIGVRIFDPPFTPETIVRHMRGAR